MIIFHLYDGTWCHCHHWRHGKLRWSISIVSNHLGNYPYPPHNLYRPICYPRKVFKQRVYTLSQEAVVKYWDCSKNVLPAVNSSITTWKYLDVFRPPKGSMCPSLTQCGVVVLMVEVTDEALEAGLSVCCSVPEDILVILPFVGKSNGSYTADKQAANRCY